MICSIHIRTRLVGVAGDRQDVVRRSVSSGVRPVVESVVTSPMLKMPNCTSSPDLSS